MGWDERDIAFRTGMIALMAERGWNQVRLAREAGLGSSVQVSQIIKERRPGSETVKWAIARAFGSTPEGVMDVGRKSREDEIAEDGLPPGPGVIGGSSKRDDIELPNWEDPPRPLDSEERQLLEWTLEVIRSEDLIPKAAVALRASIVSYREQLEDKGRPRRPRPPAAAGPGAARRPGPAPGT
jgi:transcriptional regulator with XRE-family HTH domain